MNSAKPSCQGWTLLEVLVALFISVVLLSAVVQVMVSSKETLAHQEGIAQIQENARAAILELNTDLRMSGFVGHMEEYWNIAETSAVAKKIPIYPDECFSAPFRWITPMHSDKSAGGAGKTGPMVYGSNESVGPFSGCIISTDYKPSTDVLSIHYVSGAAFEAADLQTQNVYLRADIQNGVTFKCDNTGNCLPPEAIVGVATGTHSVKAMVYFVRAWQKTPEDGIPCLVRIHFNGKQVSHEVVAVGVVDMQVQYGIDVTDAGYASQYVDTIGSFDSLDTVQPWHQVRSVSISLLLRSQSTVPKIDTKTYQVGTKFITPNTRHRHVVVRATAVIQNIKQPG